VAAPTYLYSGPSPNASLASVLAGLRVNADARRRAARRAVPPDQRVLDHVRSLGVVTLNHDDTPIIELPIAEDESLVDVSHELWGREQFVTLAPVPGVPKDKVGFRIQVTAAHTDEHVDSLIAHDQRSRRRRHPPPGRLGQLRAPAGGHVVGRPAHHRPDLRHVQRGQRDHADAGGQPVDPEHRRPPPVRPPAGARPR
jgi:hypothetical protein